MFSSRDAVFSAKNVISKNIAENNLLAESRIQDWCFQDKISNADFDCVLCFYDTIALKTPKSREKKEDRRYLDYCGKTTTEYKWTTYVFLTIFLHLRVDTNTSILAYYGILEFRTRY